MKRVIEKRQKRQNTQSHRVNSDRETVGVVGDVHWHWLARFSSSSSSSLVVTQSRNGGGSLSTVFPRRKSDNGRRKLGRPRLLSPPHLPSPLLLCARVRVEKLAAQSHRVS